MDSRKPPVRRPPPPDMGNRSRWGWPHLVLGVCLFLGFVVLSFVLGALSNRRPTADEPTEISSSRAPELEVDNGSAGLYQLAVAEEMPSEHEKQMWILAADMAMDGYCWTGSATPVRMTDFDLNSATVGSNHLSPPEPGGFRIWWQINRAPRRGARGFLAVLGRQAYSDEFRDSVLDAVEDEWLRRMAVRLPEKTFQASTDLIFDAGSIHEADSGGDAWKGFGDRAAVIEERGWSGSEEEGCRQYALVLEEVAGDYRITIDLRDTPIDNDEDGPYDQGVPWCCMTVSFTYEPTP